MKKKESLAKRIVALVLGMVSGLIAIDFASHFEPVGAEEFFVLSFFGVLILSISLLMAAVSSEVEW